MTRSRKDSSVRAAALGTRSVLALEADRIYVLERGLVTEAGTYEELLDAGGTFARLARRQLV